MIQTYKRLKITPFIRAEHNMQIHVVVFRAYRIVTPGYQTATETLLKWW